jgi:hypothetical protein
MTDSVLPTGENLRHAVRWIAEQGGATPQRIEEASVRFDLSALQEQFLLEHFSHSAHNQDAPR